VTSRRVVIGKYADGVTFGLKAALPGFDALAEADISANLSFNSNWTDIAKPLQLGFAAGSNVGSIPVGATVPVTDPGYVPYVEARLISGVTVNDDTMETSNPSRIGVGAYYIQRSPLTLQLDAAAGYQVLYVVYGVPVVLS